MYQKDIEGGQKGLPVAKVGTIWASKRIMITDIDKMYLRYKIHDFIKSLKTKPEKCSYEMAIKQLLTFELINKGKLVK